MTTFHRLATVFIFSLISTTISYSTPLLKKHNSRPLQTESLPAALDPWETPTAAFFIRSHHEIPIVDAKNWTVIIDGLVEKPLHLTLEDLKSYPILSLHAVLECSGNGRGLQLPRAAGIQWEKGAVGNAEWKGASLAAILQKAGVKPEAKFLRVEGADKPALPTIPAFVRSIPIAKVLEPDTLLAWEMNREPMPALHGGPLRLILPRWYGQNWIKWVTHLTLTAEEDPGFYMKKGYRMPKTAIKPGEKWDSVTGTPIQELRVQSFITTPRDGEKVAAGQIEGRGKAFSGAGTIAKVEISTDNGKHWVTATVESSHPTGGWQEFQFKVERKKPGKLTLLSKATDSSGKSQPLNADWNPSGYLRNSVDSVSLVVGTPPKPTTAKDIVQQRCLTCHSEEIIDEQRLAKAGWEKVIEKMEKFGTLLTPTEREILIAYYTDREENKFPSPFLPADFATERTGMDLPSKGNSLRGSKLYGESCAACHGDAGEGKTGPRLKGRWVAESVFWSAVREGRGTMPAFRDTLKTADLADIRAFMQGGE